MIILILILIIILFLFFNNNLYYENFITGTQEILLSKLQLLDKTFKNIDESIYINNPLINDKIIQKGTIIYFNGDDIPEGWALCDGTNGTPDLRDKFILGYDNIFKKKELNYSEDNEDIKYIKVENLPNIQSLKVLNYSFIDAIDDVNKSINKNSKDYIGIKTLNDNEDKYSTEKLKDKTTIISFFKNENQEGIDISPPYYVLKIIIKI